MNYNDNNYKVYLTSVNFSPMNRKRQILREISNEADYVENDWIEQELATSDFKEAKAVIKYIKEFAR